LNPVYGISDVESKNLRLGSKGKLKTSGNVDDPYPLKDSVTGKYVTGPTSTRSLNIFTMSILTIWLREHNRLCDQLYELHGESWSDDQYFNEAVSLFFFVSDVIEIESHIYIYIFHLIDYLEKMEYRILSESCNRRISRCRDGKTITNISTI